MGFDSLPHQVQLELQRQLSEREQHISRLEGRTERRTERLIVGSSALEGEVQRLRDELDEMNEERVLADEARQLAEGRVRDLYEGLELELQQERDAHAQLLRKNEMLLADNEQLVAEVEQLMVEASETRLEAERSLRDLSASSMGT